jgi:hypothetical protein
VPLYSVSPPFGSNRLRVTNGSFGCALASLGPRMGIWPGALPPSLAFVPDPDRMLHGDSDWLAVLPSAIGNHPVAAFVFGSSNPFRGSRRPLSG